MKYIIYTIVTLLALMSCNSTKTAQKRLQRIKDKHSELFTADTTYIIKNDTMYVTVSSYSHDTIVEVQDTIVIETERLRTVIKRYRDTVDYYIVQSEIKEIEVPIFTQDTIVQIREEIVMKTEYVDKIPQWLVALCVSITILYVITYIRYLNVSD